MITRRKGAAIALMGTLLASLVLTVAAPIASAAPFTNGSFEAGPTLPAANGSITLLAPNATSIPPWRVGAIGIDWIDNGYWQAQDGLRSLDLSSTDFGSVSQTFTTAPGVAYDVTFWMSGNPLGAPTVKTMTVGAGSTPAGTFNYDTQAAANTRLDMKYVKHGYTFNAACGTETSNLTFTSGIQTNFGPVLDNVSVVPAKEQPANPCPPTKLCVVKFNDLDGDGRQGPNEPNLPGWIFTVRDANGTVVGTITSTEGTPRCIERAPGTYTVTETLLGGWTPTTAGGATQTVTLVAGQTTTVTFGNHETGKGRLCIVKFNDLEGDGKQGPNEPVLFGWTFTIVHATSGAAVGTITTGDLVANCIDLPAGTYKVTETQLAGWTPTTAGGESQIVTVASGQTTTVTFGNHRADTGRICVVKFEDLNGNGRQDAGEPLLANWAFTVTDAANTAVGTLVSGTERRCVEVKPGSYTVTEILQAGWTATTPGGVTQTVTVAAGQTVILIFGNHRCCLTFTFLGGKVDNFSLANGATAEPVTPPVITATPAYFDATKGNLPFAHRIYLGTGNCIQSATLTMRIRAIKGASANDTMTIRVPGSTSWSKPISAVVPAGVWLFPTAKTVVFNLQSMPPGGGTTNLITKLDTFRMLDITIADNTSVDYIKLVVVFCECK